VRTIASIPIIRIRIAITTKVYGRRNASRTIHMEYRPLDNYLPTAASPRALISFTKDPRLATTL
jgi:hypothetical protein